MKILYFLLSALIFVSCVGSNTYNPLPGEVDLRMLTGKWIGSHVYDGDTFAIKRIIELEMRGPKAGQRDFLYLSEYEHVNDPDDQPSYRFPHLMVLDDEISYYSESYKTQQFQKIDSLTCEWDLVATSMFQDAAGHSFSPFLQIDRTGDTLLISESKLYDNIESDGSELTSITTLVRQY